MTFATGPAAVTPMPSSSSSTPAASGGSIPSPGSVDPAPESLLEIDGLSVDFNTPRGRVHALRDVSIRVPKSKVLGIVGESGSGKSTLVWSVLRLLAANGEITDGSIRFRGENVLAFDETSLRNFRGENVSMVFQDPMTAQIPVLDYRRQMTDILYRRRTLSRNDKIRMATRSMGRVGIPDPEERIRNFPHQFSGGMRQRAGIAMALLMDPALLIADEPTTALDVTMEAQIIHLIREVQSEFGCTVMVVSHNLGLIAELCDEVVVMYAGEVVEHGGVESIFFDARHPYTQALLECDPAHDLEHRRFFPTIAGDVPDLHATPRGCVFAPRCPYAGDACRSTRPRPWPITQGDRVFHDSGIQDARWSDARVDGPSHRARCHRHDPEFASQLSLNVPARRPGRARSVGPTNETPPLLVIDQLRVRFPIMSPARAVVTRTKDRFVDAVADVSLTVRPGETLGLVGESGSGKTTLGRAVLGLNPVASGSLTFRGEALVGLSQRAYRKKRRDIAMMFQDPIGSLSPRQTVRQLLTEPLIVHGHGGESLFDAAHRLCDMVSLPRTFLPRYPHELSGGQARRVGVARALALNPALVIADEPTAGLDVSVQGEVLNLMIEMQAIHGLTYLIISHNLPVIRQVSDRLAIMYLGRIVESGDCARVFERPAHPYSEALVQGAPRPDPTRRRTLVSIEGEVPSLTRRPAGCEFHPRCPHARERCRSEAPKPHTLGDGRRVACHYPLTD
ncbi:MAG: oligopeptide ABC transporter ATP-binding protein OppD [Paracoccaceae bacterium]|nr:oligopeptide ABC transporter ATP-binding protein OppD [Paracoccaceae bacterium]